MSDLEKMEKYIEKTGIQRSIKQRYSMVLSEADALNDVLLEKGKYSALFMAFEFGMAKGWRAAMNNVKEI